MKDEEGPTDDVFFFFWKPEPGCQREAAAARCEL